MKNQPNSKLRMIVLGSFLIATLTLGFTACNSRENGNVPDNGTSMNEPTETVESPDTSSNMALASVDADFLKEVSKANYHEIALGKLAKEKSKTSHVNELAQMMIDEHSKAQGEVSSLAGKKAVMLDAAMPDDQQDGYTKLSKETGKMFDKDYADAMVDGHKKVISKFEDYVKDAKDEDVKAWASATIPTLKMHLQHSEDCQKKCAKM